MKDLNPCAVCQEPSLHIFSSSEDVKYSLCWYCARRIPIMLTHVAIGARSEVDLGYIFTQKNWFLYPNVIEQLNKVGKPPQIEVLSDLVHPPGTILAISETEIINQDLIRIIICKQPDDIFAYPADFNKWVRLLPLHNQQNNAIQASNCTCQYCGGPALQLLFSIECLNKCKG